MKGKFDSLKDEVVYRATLDGCFDSLGDVQDFGWYGFVPAFYGHDYIVNEDSQGFVTVTRSDLGTGDAEWQALTEAYDAWAVWGDES